MMEPNNYEVASIRKGVRISEDLAPRKRGLCGSITRGSERFLLWCNAATLNRCMIAFRRSFAFVLYSWDLFLAVGKGGEAIGGANAPKRFKRILLAIVLVETSRHVRLRRCICHPPLFFVDAI